MTATRPTVLRRTLPHAAALSLAISVAGCPRPAPPPPVTRADVAVMAAGESRSPAGPPQGALAARVDAVAQAFRERQGRPLEDRWVDFVIPGGARTMRLRSTQDQCLGLVAVGRESITDIDLTVRNDATLVMGSDERPDAHPYVRVCLRAGQTVLAEVEVARGAGAGEVAVLLVANPPIVPPNLDAILGVRSSAMFQPPRTQRVSVGADPATPSAVDSLQAQVRRLTPLGYRRVGEVLNGTMEPSLTSETPIRLESGRCYAIVAAGGPGVDDVAVQVRAESPASERLGPDTMRDMHSPARICATSTGTYDLVVSARGGAGEWAAAVLVMDPAIELPADVVGQERSLALELAADARRHGMALTLPALRGMALGVVPLSLPVDLRAGRCYLFGAAANEFLTGTGNGGVDLALVDDHGAVAAADTAARDLARVYHCAHRDERARLDVRPAVSRGEYVVLGFESRAATP